MRKSKVVTQTSNKDINALLQDNPQSKRFLQTLNTQSTQRLVKVLGKEDSCELLVQLKDNQFVNLMEEELWQPATGGNERIDDENFVAWLIIWLTQGDEYTAERLLLMGEELLILCCARLIKVFELNVNFTPDPDLQAVFEDYLVLSQKQAHWHSLLEGLNALWINNPEYLLGVLRRSCSSQSILGEGDDTQLLELDAAWKRELSKEELGYATGIHASEFFTGIESQDLETLLEKTHYEIHTQRLMNLNKQQVLEPIASSHRIEMSAQERDDLEALTTAMEHSGVLPDAKAPLKRLTGAKSDKRTLIFEQALRSLADVDLELALWRQQELAYLANCMTTGLRDSDISIMPFTDRNKWASHQAIAIVNLGISYRYSLLDASSQTESDFFLEHLTAFEEPGLVGDFQVGWKLIRALPEIALSYFDRQVRHLTTGKRSAADAWLLEELETLYYRTDFRAALQQGHYQTLRNALEFASLIMEPQTCTVLELLIAEYPQFPAVLDRNNDAPQQVHVSRKTMPFEHVSQLGMVLKFLENP